MNTISLNKGKVKNESFRNAPYGTAYNYFTGILLSKLIFEDGCYSVDLIYDKKNKETHDNKPFREYLETEVFGTALEKDIEVNLLINGRDNMITVLITAALKHIRWQ